MFICLNVYYNHPNTYLTIFSYLLGTCTPRNNQGINTVIIMLSRIWYAQRVLKKYIFSRHEHNHVSLLRKHYLQCIDLYICYQIKCVFQK